MSSTKRFASVSTITLILVIATSTIAMGHPMDGSSWRDEHTLCQSCSINSGRVVGWWQTILWAEGELLKCGSSGIDGAFGSITDAATEEYQDDEGLSVDGVVGEQTWAHAKGKVRHRSGKLYRYQGVEHYGYLLLHDSGAWYFDPPAAPSGTYFLTDHASNSFHKC